MTGTVHCARCGEDKAGLERRVYPGELGERIRQSICPDCWAEWQQMEVIVINELRLNFMQPESQDVLVEQMREFLCLNATD
jgi:Fe-S cluster biosynthesis and repair protein YggX